LTNNLKEASLGCR